MIILLLGPDGRLGWELRRALAPLGRVVAWNRRCREADAWGDLEDPVRLAGAVHALGPDAIVNAAAFTAIDAAEADPARVDAVNRAAPAALATAAAESSAWLVHFSTDQVFDGRSDAAYADDATPNPVNAYGRSKHSGEAAVRAAGCRHLILRTSWLHAERGDNFARAILRQARVEPRLRVVHDQVGAPTGADLVADVTAHALRAARRGHAPAGTYQVCAAGAVSRFEYARHVLRWARERGLPLRAGPGDVEPVKTCDYPRPAVRPLNTRMDTRHLRQTFDLHLPDWRVGVDRMLEAGLRPAAGPRR